MKYYKEFKSDKTAIIWRKKYGNLRNILRYLIFFIKRCWKADGPKCPKEIANCNHRKEIFLWENWETMNYEWICLDCGVKVYQKFEIL